MIPTQMPIATNRMTLFDFICYLVFNVISNVLGCLILFGMMFTFRSLMLFGTMFYVLCCFVQYLMLRCFMFDVQKFMFDVQMFYFDDA